MTWIVIHFNYNAFLRWVEDVLHFLHSRISVVRPHWCVGRSNVFAKNIRTYAAMSRDKSFAS